MKIKTGDSSGIFIDSIYEGCLLNPLFQLPRNLHHLRSEQQKQGEFILIAKGKHRNPTQ